MPQSWLSACLICISCAATGGDDRPGWTQNPECRRAPDGSWVVTVNPRLRKAELEALASHAPGCPVVLNPHLPVVGAEPPQSCGIGMRGPVEVLRTGPLVTVVEVVDRCVVIEPLSTLEQGAEIIDVRLRSTDENIQCKGRLVPLWTDEAGRMHCRVSAYISGNAVAVGDWGFLSCGPVESYDSVDEWLEEMKRADPSAR